MLIGHYPDFPERLAGPENPGNSLITDGNVNKIGIYMLLPISVQHFIFTYHFEFFDECRGDVDALIYLFVESASHVAIIGRAEYLDKHILRHFIAPTLPEVGGEVGRFEILRQIVLLAKVEIGCGEGALKIINS